MAHLNSNPNSSMEGRPPKHSPNQLSIQIPSPLAASGQPAVPFSNATLKAVAAVNVPGAAAIASSSSSSSSSSTNAVQGNLTPGKSPKHNPFSSISPKRNPFMKMDNEVANGFWDGETEKEKERIKETAIEKEKEEDGDKKKQKEKEEEEEKKAATATAAAAAAVHTIKPVVVNPFLQASSGLSLNIAGNPFGIGRITGTGTGGASFLSSLAANSSSATKSVFSSSEGGILKSLSSAGAPIAVFSSCSATTGASIGISTSAAGDDDKDKDEDAEDGGEDYDPEEESTATFTPAYALNVHAVTAPGDVITGEEEEDCLLQVRAKLYRLVTVKVQTADSDHHDGEVDCSKVTTPAAAIASDASTKEWVEVGVGPLRILRNKSIVDSDTNTDTAAGRDTRIVMRREEKKGGSGTKVILNMRLRAHCVIAKNGDSAFSISTVVPKVVEVKITGGSSGAEPTTITTTKTTDELELVSYLLRCKAATETDKIMQFVQAAINAQK